MKFKNYLIVFFIICLVFNLTSCTNSSTKTIRFGQYDQDNNPENGAEDIEWYILEEKENIALIISKYYLFNDDEFVEFSGQAITWETSRARQYLNGTFLNKVFTSEEQERIITTTVKADINPTFPDIYQGNDTQDKVFLLSISEFNKYQRYIGNYYWTPTYGAKSTGKASYIQLNTFFLRTIGNNAWWSPDYTMTEYGFTFVNFSDVNYRGFAYQDYWPYLRPAMWIKLNP